MMQLSKRYWKLFAMYERFDHPSKSFIISTLMHVCNSFCRFETTSEIYIATARQLDTLSVLCNINEYAETVFTNSGVVAVVASCLLSSSMSLITSSVTAILRMARANNGAHIDLLINGGAMKATCHALKAALSIGSEKMVFVALDVLTCFTENTVRTLNKHGL